MYQFLEEIKQQPDLFSMLYESEYGHIQDIAAQIVASHPNKIILAGCGDAYSNAMLCKEYIHRLTEWEAVSEEPFNLVNEERSRLSEQDVLVVFSAKGKSKMIMELIELAKEKKTTIVCITNVPDSPAAQSSNMVIPIHAGEWKAPRTKAITLSALASLLFAFALAGKKKEYVQEIVEELAHTSAKVIEESFLCGMPETVSYATAALQKIAVEAAAVEEIAATVHSLSLVIQYGNIRKIPSEALAPVFGQLFLRACLLLPGSCVCDDNASRAIIEGVGLLNEAALHHDFLPEERWLQVLEEIADRDDLNTKVSGYAAAILLERGKMSNEELELKVGRRLSKGIPADLGAGWFEGLSMKNRYALITRMGLWESLDHYLDTLDDEEFKRALLFLRRAFADFTAREKSDIAENLGELWQLNPQQVSEAVNAPLSDEAQEMLDGLDDFDFGDI